MATQMILQGHVLDELGNIPDEFFNCVITSPPYWGLRDYGLEPMIWDAVDGCEHEWDTQDRIVESFSGKGAGWLIGHEKGEKDAKQISRKEHPEYWEKKNIGSSFCSLCGAWRGSLGLEPTFQLYIQHLMQIFKEVWRVLRKDGTCWVNIGDTYAGSGGCGSREYHKSGHTQFGKPYTRDEQYQAPKPIQDNVQSKSLCQIPSRFSIAMTDAGWILRNEIIWYKRNCMPSSAKDRFTVDFEKVFFFTKDKKYWFEQQREGNDTYKTVAKVGQKRFGGNTAPGQPTIREDRIIETVGRNKRCVWDITTQPFKGAHFAVFPNKLVEPMLSAGCPVDGWVLDPFAGSGTVGVVAKEQDKNFIGIELNPDYCKMADRRIE